MKQFLMLTLCLLIGFHGFAQVREVTSRATDYKEETRTSSSRTDSYSNDGGSGFLATLFSDLLFGSIYHGLNAAQYAQLNNADVEDWRKSLELGVYGGINFAQVEFFNAQSLRGNWGLFSTQFRRFSVDDVSGAFTTLDWQILQLNLLNREHIRWLVGFGFSHETQVAQTHFEWVSELQMILNKLMPSVSFRRSGDGVPRAEFSAMLEYRPFKERRAELSFSVGYLHQRLYDIPFDFLSLGLGFRLK